MEEGCKGGKRERRNKGTKEGRKNCRALKCLLQTVAF